MPFTRRTALKGMLATAVGAVTGATVYGTGYERHQLGVTEETIWVKGLASSWDGRRIALLTDIHHSALVSADDVEQAVTLANAQKPDMIVLGGDYVTNGDRDFAEPVAELLAPLTAPLGVYAILGNHDDDRDVPAALSRRGIAVLRDQPKSVFLRGEGIDLVGIRFWTRERSKIEPLLKDARNPVILLAHDPRRLLEAAALNVPVVLSGHTHGGQVVLPGLGAPAARKFPVVEGLASMGDTTLFVSRGVGTVYLPVRINCPPEVAILTLRSEK